jgi:hypothetical protein
MRAGRRTKLTIGLQRKLCAIIATPCTIRTACEACGISETSFYEWIRRGEAGEKPFSQFADAVAHARARGKIRVVNDLWQCKDPRVKLELLSRIYPNEFGRRDLAPIPVEPQPEPRPAVAFVLADRKSVSFEEAQKIYGDFPVQESPGESPKDGWKDAENRRFTRHGGIVELEPLDGDEDRRGQT